MTALSSLWLPIVVSAVLVFIASSVIHMLTPWHKTDFGKLPDEDRARDGLRALALPPGDYMTPCPSSAEEMRSPEFKAKLEQGPRVVMTVMPNGPVSMGKNLAQWFIYCVVVGLFAAYIVGRTTPQGAPYMHVFQLTAVTTFVGHSLALWPASIWYQRSWTTTLKSTVDGAIYALITAGVFGWLWAR
ncbi:MAG TPA: hypothetical protein VEU32_00240 [Burkholderiales bacterium]|nr:hypothetical protein [Burkholderiales bacterium]